MRPMGGRAILALAITIIAVPAFAGCLADERAMEIPHDWAARALPFGQNHDHYDHLHHQDLSTANFELLGYDPLISEHLGRTASGHLCADAGASGDRVIGVVHALSDDVLFTVLDVTDPANPFWIGEVVTPNAPGRDVALTEDGRYVAVAVSADTSPTPPTGAAPGADLQALINDRLPFFRDACGEERPIPILEPDYTPSGPGVWLFDLADPTQPVFADQFIIPTAPLGTHSITAGDLDGKQVLAAGIVNLVSAISNFWFFEVVDGSLELGGVYQEPANEGNAPLLNGHNDAWMQVHPVTGQHLAYLANWNQGMAIIDISDMSDPQPVGRYHDNPSPNADLQTTSGTGSVHEAFPLDTTWDGRHYTFIGQEILTHPADTPSGWIRVLDTTDPSDPHVVGEWTLPEDVEWGESLVWSTHYLDVVDRTLFVAHYHAGVWAIDMRGVPDDPHPPAVGVFVPSNASPAPPDDASYDWAPTIMEMNSLPGGELVVWDSASGAYTVRFDDTNRAPPASWYD